MPILLPHQLLELFGITPPVPEIREGHRPPMEADIEEEIKELIVRFAKLSLGPALAH